MEYEGERERPEISIYLFALLRYIYSHLRSSISRIWTKSLRICTVMLILFSI